MRTNRTIKTVTALNNAFNLVRLPEADRKAVKSALRAAVKAGECVNGAKVEFYQSEWNTRVSDEFDVNYVRTITITPFGVDAKEERTFIAKSAAKPARVTVAFA